MKFMKQVGEGEINLEQGLTEQEAQNWSEEYVSATAKEDGDLLAQNWANQHASSTGKVSVRLTKV